MADAPQFGTQELLSAWYFTHTGENIETEAERCARGAQPRSSKLEQTVRWLTPLVIVMLVSAAGGLYWLNRASIASAAEDLKHRRSPVDMVLWASGSKQTFNGALSNTLKRTQRDSAYQLDQMKPAFKTEFDKVDFQNLSESWNGKRSR